MSSNLSSSLRLYGEETQKSVAAFLLSPLKVHLRKRFHGRMVHNRYIATKPWKYPGRGKGVVHFFSQSSIRKRTNFNHRRWKIQCNNPGRPFFDKFGPNFIIVHLKWNWYLKISNAQNSIEMLTLFVSNQKYTFCANLVQKIQFLSWNLVPGHLIWICRIQWLYSLSSLDQRIRFGQS